MSSFPGEDRVALWAKEGSQAWLPDVCDMFHCCCFNSSISHQHSSPCHPTAVPRRGEHPCICPPSSTTGVWPPATAPSLPGANPTRAWLSTCVKQWYLKAHSPSQEDLLHLLIVRNETTLQNLPEFWAGTPGDTYMNRHGREKGLEKLLGRS